jgi:hypothetical protein
MGPIAILEQITKRNIPDPAGPSLVLQIVTHYTEIFGRLSTVDEKCNCLIQLASCRLIKSTCYMLFNSKQEAIRS